jgi:hypothetical protein
VARPVVDVTVRWRNDVVAIERLDLRAVRARTVDVGPLRLDAAQLALPCTLTRGPFVVSVRNDDTCACAVGDREIDPVLLRAAGVPFVLMAGLFAALFVTAPRFDDSAFAFDLATHGSTNAGLHGGLHAGLHGGAPPRVRQGGIRFAHARPRSSAVKDPSEAQRVLQDDSGVFRSIPTTPVEETVTFTELMSAVGEIGAASSSSSDVFAQMSDATRAALFNSGARSGGDIGTGAALGLGVGLGRGVSTGTGTAHFGSTIGIGSGAVRRRARIEASDVVMNLFGPGELGTNLAAEIRAIDTRELRPSSAALAAIASPPRIREPPPRRGVAAIESKSDCRTGPADSTTAQPEEPPSVVNDATETIEASDETSSCSLAPAIREAMRARMPAVRVCALRFPDAAIGPRLVLKWSVREDGSFVDVRAQGVEPAALASCLEDALEGTRIADGCAGTDVIVTYPLLFDGAGD